MNYKKIMAIIMVSSVIFSINIPVIAHAQENNIKITNQSNLNVQQVRKNVNSLFTNSDHNALNTNCYRRIDIVRLEVNGLPESQEKLDLADLMYKVFDLYLEQNNIKSVRERIDQLFIDKEQTVLKSNSTSEYISSIFKLIESFKLPKSSSVAKDRLYILHKASIALQQKQIVVNIPDSNFKALLNRKLGRNNTDYITKAQLATITYLDINDSKIKDWHGIEYTNLNSFSLDASKLAYTDEENTWQLLRPSSNHKTLKLKKIFIKNCSQEFFDSARWSKGCYPYLEKLHVSGGSISRIYSLRDINGDIRIENQKLTGKLSYRFSYNGDGIAFILGRNRTMPVLKISDGGKLDKSGYWINWTEKQLKQSKKDYVSCSWDDGIFSGEMVFHIPSNIK